LFLSFQPHGGNAMAIKNLKCPKCDRKFSMPGHLARHMNATHGMKRTAARAKSGRKPGRPRGPASRTQAPISHGGADLLARMQEYHRDLLARCASVDTEIAAIRQAIGAMGAATPAATSERRRGRPPGSGQRTGSLRHHVLKVLGQRKKPVSPKGLADAAVHAGYQSKAKDLTKAVGNLLAELKQVKRVGFGQYQL